MHWGNFSGGYWVTPAKMTRPDPLTQQFSTRNSAGHTPNVYKMPKYSTRLLTGKLWKHLEVHQSVRMWAHTCMCLCVCTHVCTLHMCALVCV